MLSLSFRENCELFRQQELGGTACLVAPHAGKDVVELDVDGGEGQETSHQHLRDRFPIPGQGRDLPWVLSRPHWRIELRLHAQKCPLSAAPNTV